MEMIFSSPNIHQTELSSLSRFLCSSSKKATEIMNVVSSAHCCINLNILQIPVQCEEQH